MRAQERDRSRGRWRAALSGRIAVVDSGPLYAAVDADDEDHRRSRETLETPGRRLIIPAMVVSEVTYSLGQRLGPQIESRFLAGLRTLVVEAPLPEEWDRIAELVRTYQDFPLGGTDASVVALAERLNADLLITLDRRHFAAVRPRHVPTFRILPDECSPTTSSPLDRLTPRPPDASIAVGTRHRASAGDARRSEVKRETTQTETTGPRLATVDAEATLDRSAPDGLLTPAEAAAVLGIQEDILVGIWCRTGFLRCVDDGRQWLVPTAEVERVGDSVQVRDIRALDRLHELTAELGSDEGMSEEELEILEASRPGRLPWQEQR